ncbi:tetratricopeptide repeat protein [Nonomuraea sp. NPDC050790]|uniref:tetratricopeptide repeat protein n=1 Tax=Nonomuraea sp. NPDC050790 TaxID=3364371 RepID=UPI0037A688CC
MISRVVMRRVLGPDHPNTLTSRNNLASAYRESGDLGQAVPLLEATLTDSERVLGPDHPHTLGSRTNLASAHYTAGDLGRAIPLLETTLTDCERVLGPDHPTTRVVRSKSINDDDQAGSADLRRRPSKTRFNNPVSSITFDTVC